MTNYNLHKSIRSPLLQPKKIQNKANSFTQYAHQVIHLLNIKVTMKIDRNSTQLNPTQLKPVRFNESTVLTTVRSLAQKNITPSPLVLTHAAVDAQIEGLVALQTQLASESTSSGSSIAYNKLSTNIHALQTLKNRDFQPLGNPELVISFSGKGFGAGKNEDKIAKAKTALEKEIQSYDADIKKKQDKVEDILDRLDMVDPEGSDAKGFNAVHVKLDREITALNAKRAIAKTKLSNLLNGASSSR